MTQVKQQKNRTIYDVPVPNRPFGYRADLGATGDAFTVTGWLQSADAIVRSQISNLVGTLGILDLQENLNGWYSPFDQVFYAQANPAPNPVTAVNGTSIDTTQSPPFGTGAGKFVAASSQYLSAPNASWMNFGSGNFTVDFWVKFNSLPTSGGYMYLFAHDQNANNYYSFSVANTSGTYSVGFQAYTSSSLNVNTSANSSPNLTTGTWYHFAVVCSGNSLYIFQTGTQIGSTQSITGSITNTGDFEIAALQGASAGHTLDGWFKEFRVSNVARWTSNFTPPTAEYSPDPFTYLLLHMDPAPVGQPTFIDSCGGSTYTNDTGASSPFNVLAAATDIMYFGFHQRINLINFVLSTNGNYGGSSNLIWEYSQGGGSWNILGTYTDGTSGLSQSGAFTLTPPSDWCFDTVNGFANLFWLRVGALSVTTTAQLQGATLPYLNLNPCYQCLLENPQYTLSPTVYDYVDYQLVFDQVENPFTPTNAAAGFDPLGFNSTGFST